MTLPELSSAGKLAGVGIGLTAVALLTSSGLGLQLGLPTAICGVMTAIAVMILKRSSPWPMVKGVCWAVLPLVAGLFVLVEALDKTGLIRIDRRFAARRCPTLRVGNGVGRRRSDRIRLQSHEQPSGRLSLRAPLCRRLTRQNRLTSAIVVGVDSAPISPSPDRSPPSSGSPRSAARTSMSAPGRS